MGEHSIDSKVHLLCIDQIHNYMTFGNIFLTGFFTKFIDGKCVLTSTKSNSMLSSNVGQGKGLPSHC